jgi:glycine cleavage system protein P-like pyridoxal-binding family
MLREYAIPEISENDLVTVVDNICGGELSGERSIEPIGSCIGTATLGIYRVVESAVRKTG